MNDTMPLSGATVLAKAARFAGLLILLLWMGCARPGNPTGGPKDDTPPKLDTLYSSANFTTHFKEKEIRLTFDEWVVLKETATQIVVSPPVKPRPSAKIKGKTVVLKFEDTLSLRPATTYTINFGTAVRDLHEDNPAENLIFVFSTGDVIDTVAITGSVADAYTAEALEGITLLLYDEDQDSLPERADPVYYAKTNSSGQYTIPFIRNGRYKLVAVEDKSQNLKWDRGNEKIGFSDTMIVADRSQKTIPAVRLFENLSPLRLKSVDHAGYGFITLTYTAIPDALPEVRSTVPDMKIIQEQHADTLLVWYDGNTAGKWNLLLDQDTIPGKSHDRDAFATSSRLQWAGTAAAAAPKKRIRQKEAAPDSIPPTNNRLELSLPPFRPAALPFNHPPDSYNPSAWILTRDTLEIDSFFIKPDSARRHNLLLDAGWKPGSRYALTLLPGAVTDFYGIANTDTLFCTLTIVSENKFGDMNLSIQPCVVGMTYLVQLQQNGKTVEEKTFTADNPLVKLRFEHLPLAAYDVLLIEDNNQNGRWDSGNYLDRRQPEIIHRHKTEALRAGFDLETIFSIGKRDKFGRQ